MSQPLRTTRRAIACWIMALITVIIAWVIAPGDIGAIESGLLMVIIPALTTGIITFITGETYSDHSARKHGSKSD